MAISSPHPPTETEYAPWLDLPDPLTELILERLPLSDYVRFPAVCRQWRLIQRAHRLRHSPRQPPMLPLPWFTLSPTVCYSPLERRLYRFHHSTPVGGSRRYLASSHGWILLKEGEARGYGSMLPFAMLSLLNPVSGVTIELPDLPASIDFGCACVSVIHPDRVVVMAGYDDSIFLWRAGSPRWAQLPLPARETVDFTLVTAIFLGGRFYAISADMELFVIDPSLPVPAVQLLDMDWSNVDWSARAAFLVESDGQVLLLNMPYGQDPFELFRADFSAKKWVWFESLGDRAIFANFNCTFSLLAAEVGVRANCIYFPEAILDEDSHAVPWKRYDLSAGELIDGEPIPNAITGYCCIDAMTYGLNVVPRIDAIDPEGANIFE